MRKTLERNSNDFKFNNRDEGKVSRANSNFLVSGVKYKHKIIQSLFLINILASRISRSSSSRAIMCKITVKCLVRHRDITALQDDVGCADVSSTPR